MRSRVCLLSTVLLLLVPAASAHPDFFETPILEDPADYGAQPGLDVVTLGHWTTYYYDAQNKVHRGFYLNVCVGFVDLTTAEGVRVHLFATINGTMREFWADVGFVGAKVVIVDRNTNATANQTSVTFNLPFHENDVAEGVHVSDLFVATSTNHKEAFATQGPFNRIFHDLMPFDNEDKPTLYLVTPEVRGSIVVEKPWPFFRLDPSTPLAVYMVPRDEARFRILFTPAEGLKDDVVRFFPALTAGWNLSSNYQFLGPFGDQPMEVSFSLGRDNATVGETGTALIRAISNRGGYQTIELNAKVISPQLWAPERFLFVPAAPTVGREEALRVHVLGADGTPASHSAVVWELRHDGALVASNQTITDADGVATLVHLFDRPGRWTLAVSLPNESPAPLAEFGFEVVSPSVPLTGGWAVAAIVAALVLGRRRH